MILRLTQKLAAHAKVPALTTLELAADPLSDFSLQLFKIGQTPFLLVTNTASLFSAVTPAKSITTPVPLINLALTAMHHVMQAQGLEDEFFKRVLPHASVIEFAKNLNRSVIGSMNEMIYLAGSYCCHQPPVQASIHLNETPMGSLKYVFPSAAFRALLA